MERMVTPKQAAKMLNMTRQAIYLAIKQNRLKGYTESGQVKVFMSEIEESIKNNNSYTRRKTSDGKPKFEEDKGYYCTSRAEMLFEIPATHLYYAARMGKIRHQRSDAQYVFHAKDLQYYREIYFKKKLKENAA